MLVILMTIPFTKAHGAQNDFLLTWLADAPADDLPPYAVAICDRRTGVGADGWLLIERTPADADAAIRLFNSDGSEAEISGNGTRCAAAFLMANGRTDPDVHIRTGAGVKRLRLLSRQDLSFVFEMNMGAPKIEAAQYQLDTSGGPRDCTILWAGNPQCALPVRDFDFEWAKLGAEIERHPRFQKRTNVSFFRALDQHTIEARFFERGAGETMSSGTGSTGAAAAAIRRGLVSSPVRVLTPAGPLDLRQNEGGEIFLIGPAEIVAEGSFFAMRK